MSSPAPARNVVVAGPTMAAVGFWCSVLNRPARSVYERGLTVLLGSRIDEAMARIDRLTDTTVPVVVLTAGDQYLELMALLEQVLTRRGFTVERIEVGQ